MTMVQKLHGEEGRGQKRTGSRFCCRCRDLPDDPWVRPAANSAMQPHTLLLPHSVGARLNHKLRGVHQAVFVHALEMLLVFMDLKTKLYFNIKYSRFLSYCQTNQAKMISNSTWCQEESTMHA